MPFQFQQGTALTKKEFATEESLWHGYLTSKFNVGNVPNGGYTTSVALIAAMKHVELVNPQHCDPLVMSAYFVGSTISEQEVHVKVGLLKAGKLTTLVSVELSQGGKVKIRAQVLFGILNKDGAVSKYLEPDAKRALTGIETQLDKLVPKSNVMQGKGSTASFARSVFSRYEVFYQPLEVPSVQRMLGILPQDEMPGHSAGTIHTPTGLLPEYTALTRFADQEKISVAALPAFADSNVPCVKAIPKDADVGWVPTLSWTLHFMCKVPQSIDFLACRFKTYAAHDGFMVEDCEIVDPTSNQLLMVSRQHAMMSVTQQSKPKL